MITTMPISSQVSSDRMDLTRVFLRKVAGSIGAFIFICAQAAQSFYTNFLAGPLSAMAWGHSGVTKARQAASRKKHRNARQIVLALGVAWLS